MSMRSRRAPGNLPLHRKISAHGNTVGRGASDLGFENLYLAARQFHAVGATPVLQALETWRGRCNQGDLSVVQIIVVQPFPADNLALAIGGKRVDDLDAVVSPAGTYPIDDKRPAEADVCRRFARYRGIDDLNRRRRDHLATRTEAVLQHKAAGPNRSDEPHPAVGIVGVAYQSTGQFASFAISGLGIEEADTVPTFARAILGGN